MNSRQKGKRGELEAAHVLQEYGFDARRGQQYAGINGDADVVGVPGYHLEIKRNEHLNLEEAVKQSVRDAREGERPIVMHRKNRGEWLVTIRLDDFMNLIGHYRDI
jgi:Holliday junction resolvase